MNPAPFASLRHGGGELLSLPGHREAIAGMHEAMAAGGRRDRARAFSEWTTELSDSMPTRVAELAPCAVLDARTVTYRLLIKRSSRRRSPWTPPGPNAGTGGPGKRRVVGRPTGRTAGLYGHQRKCTRRGGVWRSTRCPRGQEDAPAPIDISVDLFSECSTALGLTDTEVSRWPPPPDAMVADATDPNESTSTKATRATKPPRRVSSPRRPSRRAACNCGSG